MPDSPMFAYAVTFESTTRPSQTVRGVVKGSAGAACRRAFQEASKKRKPKTHFESWLVLMEKLDE